MVKYLYFSFSLLFMGVFAASGMEDPQNNDDDASPFTGKFIITHKSTVGTEYGTEVHNEALENNIKKELQSLPFEVEPLKGSLFLMEYESGDKTLGVVHDLTAQKIFISYIEQKDPHNIKNLRVVVERERELEREAGSDEYLPGKFKSRTSVFYDIASPYYKEPVEKSDNPVSKHVWYNPFTWGRSDRETPNENIRKFQENSRSKFEQQKMQNKQTGDRIDYKFASKEDQKMFENTVQSIMDHYHNPEGQQAIKKYCDQYNSTTYQLARQEAEKRMSQAFTSTMKIPFNASQKEEPKKEPMIPIYNDRQEIIGSMPASQIDAVLADQPGTHNAEENQNTENAQPDEKAEQFFEEKIKEHEKENKENKEKQEEEQSSKEKDNKEKEDKKSTSEKPKRDIQTEFETVKRHSSYKSKMLNEIKNSTLGRNSAIPQELTQHHQRNNYNAQIQEVHQAAEALPQQHQKNQFIQYMPPSRSPYPQQYSNSSRPPINQHALNRGYQLQAAGFNSNVVKRYEAQQQQSQPQAYMPWYDDDYEDDEEDNRIDRLNALAAIYQAEQEQQRQEQRQRQRHDQINELSNNLHDPLLTDIDHQKIFNELQEIKGLQRGRRKWDHTQPITIAELDDDLLSYLGSTIDVCIIKQRQNKMLENLQEEAKKREERKYKQEQERIQKEKLLEEHHALQNKVHSLKNTRENRNKISNPTYVSLYKTITGLHDNATSKSATLPVLTSDNTIEQIKEKNKELEHSITSLENQSKESQKQYNKLQRQIKESKNQYISIRSTLDIADSRKENWTAVQAGLRYQRRLQQLRAQPITLPPSNRAHKKSTNSASSKKEESLQSDDDQQSVKKHEVPSSAQPTSLEDCDTIIQNDQNIAYLLDHISATDMIVTSQGQDFLERSGIDVQKCMEFNGNEQQNALNDKLLNFANYIGNKIATDESELAQKVRRIGTNVLHVVNCCKEQNLIEAGSALLQLSTDLIRFSTIPEETIAKTIYETVTHPGEYIQQRVDNALDLLKEVARFAYHVTQAAEMGEFEQFGNFGTEREAKLIEEQEIYGRWLAERIEGTISSLATMPLKEREEVFAHLIADGGVDYLAGSALVSAAKVGKKIINPRTPAPRAPHFHASSSHTIVEVDEATGLTRIVSPEELTLTKVAQESGQVFNQHVMPQESTCMGHNEMPLLEEMQPSSSKQPKITITSNAHNSYSLPSETFTAYKEVIEDGSSKIIQLDYTAKDALEILNNSKELRLMNDQIATLKNTTPETKFIISDRRILEVDKYLKALDSAENFYETMRVVEDDIQKISYNTGVSASTIQQIKNHLFVDDHILSHRSKQYIGKFSADIDIAEAWQRLIDGNFVQSDLVLLQHELAESLIMQGTAIDYETAHRQIVDNIFNWSNTLGKSNG